MATKKGVSKGAGKKSGAKKSTASKTSAARRGAVKKTTVKAGAVGIKAKLPPPTGEWVKLEAWQEDESTLSTILHVKGRCRFPTHGYKLFLKEVPTPNSNPAAILLLLKVVVPPSNPSRSSQPQELVVHFEKEAHAHYISVIILPDGPEVEVKQVR